MTSPDPNHDKLVAAFRAKLAERKSPLDSIPVEQLVQAREEFAALPEVAGEPLTQQPDLG